MHLAGQPDAGDVTRSARRAVEHGPDGEPAGPPPVVRRLLGPAGLRRGEGRVVFSRGAEDAPAVVDEERPAAARADVDAEKRHAGKGYRYRIGSSGAGHAVDADDGEAVTGRTQVDRHRLAPGGMAGMVRSDLGPKVAIAAQALGQVGARRDRCQRVGCGHGLGQRRHRAIGVIVDGPGNLVAGARLGVAVSLRQVGEGEAGGRHGELVQRVHQVEIEAGRLVLARDDRLDEVRLGGRIAVLAGRDDSGDLFRREPRDDLRGPERVPPGHSLEGRIRVVVPPPVRVVGVRFVAPDRREIGKLDLPVRRHTESETGDVPLHERRVEPVLIAQVRELGLDATAAECGAEVQQEVANVAPSLVFDPDILRVVCPRVIVIEPGGEHPQAAQLSTVLVRDHVVRVVAPRAVVPERAQR